MFSVIHTHSSALTTTCLAVLCWSPTQRCRKAPTHENTHVARSRDSIDEIAWNFAHPSRNRALSTIGAIRKWCNFEISRKTKIFKSMSQFRLPCGTLAYQKLIENKFLMTSRGYGVDRNEKLYRTMVSNGKSASRIPSHVLFYGAKRTSVQRSSWMPIAPGPRNITCR